MHWAAYKGNAELVALFAGMGLPLDAQDSFGQTPLHLASLRNNFAAVEVLVEAAEERGIKEVLLKLADKEGKTPIECVDKSKKSASAAVNKKIRTLLEGIAQERGRRREEE